VSLLVRKLSQSARGAAPWKCCDQCSSIFALYHSAFCFFLVVVVVGAAAAAAAAAAAKLHPEISHTPPPPPRVGIDLCPEQDVELLVVLSNIVPLTLSLHLANSSRPLTTEPFSRGYYQARSAETLSVRRSFAPQPTGCFTHLLAYMEILPQRRTYARFRSVGAAFPPLSHVQVRVVTF
jgi:hypothetical protein